MTSLLAGTARLATIAASIAVMTLLLSGMGWPAMTEDAAGSIVEVAAG